MEKIINFIYLVAPACIYLANAQMVIKTDTLSGTEISISSSKNISDLMDKLENNCNKNTSVSNKWDNVNEKNSSSNSSEERISVPSKKLTDAEICRKNPRIMGYKIQLAVVKSNNEANEVKAYFRRRFPSIKAETDASLRPNYKILAGSYFTKASAAEDLKRIRQYFKSANAVQYYIFCEEGK